MIRRFLLVLALVTLPLRASAVEAFTITNFHDEIAIQRDGSVTVDETIAVDFGSNERHGIFRTIPTRYQTKSGATRSIRISDINARDNGRSVPFDVSRSGGELMLKLGDPSQLISGQHGYAIHYRVQNALNEFSDHDELYWNVTGNGWDTTIQSASARATLPSESTNLKAQGFQGVGGSNEAATATNGASDFMYATTRALEPGEGLTLVAGWPKGLVTFPSAWQRTVWFVADNGVLLVPVFVLIVLAWYIRRYARDPLSRRTIVPEFAPPNDLSLLEQTALRDERIQPRDLTALIVSWAVDGFIRIEEPTKGQYELVAKNDLTGRTDAEHALFTQIFSYADDQGRVKLSDINHKLASAAGKLHASTFNRLVERGYFVSNPETIRSLFLAVGVGIAIFGVYLSSSTPWLIAFVASGGLIALSAPLMPRRTLEGVKRKEQIEGFELYLKTAERYRMQFAEKEKLFERYLPYAIALGVATLWAKAFGDIAKTAPSWYGGYYGMYWSPVNFAQGMQGGLTNSFGSVMTTASSGGSGFSGGGSGGGFGGGGGGSW